MATRRRGGGAAELAVVIGAAAVVGEEIVGVFGLAEAARGFGASGGVSLGVVVRVVAVGEAEEGVLDVGLAGVARDPKRLVVVGAHRRRRRRDRSKHGKLCVRLFFLSTISDSFSFLFFSSRVRISDSWLLPTFLATGRPLSFHISFVHSQ